MTKNMSELFETVRRSYFHEVLSNQDTESRLEGREGSYLFRVSDVKPGIFVISYVKSSSVCSVTHILHQTVRKAAEDVRLIEDLRRMITKLTSS